LGHLILMSKRKKIALASIIAVLITPVFITLLVLQNPPWAHSPVIRNAQALVSAAILSSLDVVDIPANQRLYPVTKIKTQKLEALKAGRVMILTADEISPASFKEPPGLDDHFVIATIDPVDVEGKNTVTKRKLIGAVDRLAIDGKIDLIIEATASDSARANSWGQKEVRCLQEAGVVRCVIFDGGHHTNTLPLQPDILLLPVIKRKGEDYVSHWYTRDSVQVSKLRKALSESGMDTVIAEFPRNGIPIKNPSGMALIAKQAILKMTEEAEGTPGDKEMGILPTNRTAQPDSVGDRSSSINNSLFVWIKAGPGETKEDILKQLSGEIDKQKKAGGEIERIYAGITFGISRFPHAGEKIEFNGEELEGFLNKRISKKVTVLTEPFSTWDLYIEKFTRR